MLQPTQNNRPEHARWARNDCTVRALATTSGLPYDAVANILYAAGRRPDKGFAIYDWLAKHNGRVLGCDYVMCYRPDTCGIFLLGNAGHVSALIDNVPYDDGGRGVLRFRWCYRVTRGTHDVGELDHRHVVTKRELLATI